MADIELVQGDTAPDITATLRLTATSGALNLTSAEGVRFQMGRLESKEYNINAPAQIVNAPAGTVRYVLQPGDLAQHGDFEAQWEIDWGDEAIQTTTPANTVSVRRQ